MPYLSGPFTRGGAVLDVLVGVPTARAALLRRHSFPVPEPLPVRALIDTGSSVSGFAPRVFSALDLTRFDQIKVLTPST